MDLETINCHPNVLNGLKSKIFYNLSKITDKENLICIPQKYTSFIKPVSYPWIHRGLSKSEKEGYFTVNFGWHCSPFKSEKVW